MIFFANILVLGAFIALGFLFKQIEWTLGAEAVTTFSLGWIAATVMWQSVHKIRYGHWFDPPNIEESEAAGVRDSVLKAGADGFKPLKNLAASGDKAKL